MTLEQHTEPAHSVQKADQMGPPEKRSNTNWAIIATLVAWPDGNPNRSAEHMAPAMSLWLKDGRPLHTVDLTKMTTTVSSTSPAGKNKKKKLIK